MMGQTLSRVEAEHRDPLAAFDYVTVAIRNFHDAGSTTVVRSALTLLAALFDRLGRYEPAATIAGFALTPFAARSYPSSTPRSLTSAMSSGLHRQSVTPTRLAALAVLGATAAQPA